MKLVIFFLLFASMTGFNEAAAFTSHTIWKIKGHSVWFIHDKEKLLQVSKSCGVDLAKAKCQALLSLKKLSMKDLRAEDFKMGKNPSSALCAHSAKGEVNIAKNSKGQRKTFCLFKDGSMAANDTLHFYANLNDSRTVKGKKSK